MANSNLERVMGIVEITLTVSGSPKKRTWSPNSLLDATVLGYCFYIWAELWSEKWLTCEKLPYSPLQDVRFLTVCQNFARTYTHRITIKTVSILSMTRDNIQYTLTLWKEYILNLSTHNNQKFLQLYKGDIQSLPIILFLNSIFLYVTSEN